jgi:Ca2+-binding RTX toxin-like protein
LTGAAAINGGGNGLANILIGNNAVNALFGNGGNDTLDGGQGADKMYGAAGDDTYVVDNASDVTFEGSALDGTDLVQSSVTRSLGANLENLTLTGTAAINGIGNSLANIINGNAGANQLFGNLGDDVLNGGAGNDLLIGAGGNDRFVFAPGSGADTVNNFLAGGIDDSLDFSAYDGTGITWTITQIGANTVFDFTNGDQITLTNVIAANLVQTDPFGFG